MKVENGFWLSKVFFGVFNNFAKNETSFTSAGQGGAAGHHKFEKTIEKKSSSMSHPLWITLERKCKIFEV